jgi:hypothetical protein
MNATGSGRQMEWRGASADEQGRAGQSREKASRGFIRKPIAHAPIGSVRTSVLPDEARIADGWTARKRRSRFAWFDVGSVVGRETLRQITARRAGKTASGAQAFSSRRRLTGPTINSTGSRGLRETF